MDIQWLGHSAFKLVESTGTTIVTDPFDNIEVGYNMPQVSCDVVTVCSRECTETFKSCSQDKLPLLINSEGAFEVDGVHIVSICEPKGQGSNANGLCDNLIFKFRMDGVDICHLGNVNTDCSVELSEAIGSVDILLVPVGGGDTISAELAKEYVDLLMPDVVIPMNFKTRNCNLDIDKVGAFLRQFDDAEVVTATAPVQFDRTEFDGESTKIIVFNI